MRILRSFGTHNGSFHADEATACALLLLVDRVDKDKIVRTREMKLLEECEYVCDVGGIYDPGKKRFDHHQVEYRGSLSSAGMVLLFLKDTGSLDHQMYEYFNKSLILGVDAHDNGLAKIEPGTTTFSQVVSNFLPIGYDADEKEMDRTFFIAVEFILGHLLRLKGRFEYTRSCQVAVREKMAAGTNALVFDESLPWIENFFELGGELHPAQFVIMPSGNHWKLRGIPPSLNERMKVRKPLPESWAGLREEELKKVSGIDGAVFCHKGRFISIWATKKDALKALHIALAKEVR